MQICSEGPNPSHRLLPLHEVHSSLKVKESYVYAVLTGGFPVFWHKL